MIRGVSHRQWLSWILMSALFTLVVGLGCGSLPSLDAHSCCMKNPACHRADGAGSDPKRCCQTGKQSRERPATQIDFTLVGKILNGADLPSAPFDQLSLDNQFKTPSAFLQEILKFPQTEIYQLTSALLI